MGKQLDHLTEADIQTRCSETSLERGRGYYKGGAVRQRARLDDGLDTRVSGTYTYRVTVREATVGTDIWFIRHQLSAHIPCPDG